MLGRKKNSCHKWGLNHLPFACEASALTTEPLGLMVVEVTRMPIYTTALGSVPTQYLNSPTLFSFFFPFFFSPSLFLSFCFVDFTFLPFSFFSSYFFPPFFPLLFFLLCLLFNWYVRPMSGHLEGRIVLALRKLI